MKLLHTSLTKLNFKVQYWITCYPILCMYTRIQSYVFITVLLWFMSSSTAQAQGNLGINVAIPDPSAILDVTASTRGLLIPRMALTATTSPLPVTAPATSLLVYNTATAGISPDNVTPGYYYWDGAKWLGIGSNSWQLTGNAGTVAGTQFIGTADAQDVVFKSNAIENMRILTSNGNIGIGTATPAFKLHVPAGYIGTDYVNTTDNAVAAGVTGIMVKQGDNFLRTGNAASVLSFLGVTAPTGDNLGNHVATTALNMNNNFINNAQGSSIFAQSSATSTSYVDAPIQLRESQYAGGLGAKPPRISFHWAGIVASQIGIEASGRIAVLNNPGTGYENFVANENYANGWFRNINVNTGLYNEVTGTGIFSPSAGVMAIYNNGSLGIGTIAPTAQLDVAGTARIQTLPAGANTESVLTVDVAGNVHKKAAGFTGATYVGTVYHGDIGAVRASTPVTGYITSASISVYSCGASRCRGDIQVNFPNIGTTNYVVLTTPTCLSCGTAAQADDSDDILPPLIRSKTTTGFKMFVEENQAVVQDITWDIIIITY